MIDAAKTSFVALVLGAHDGAAMTASIEEASHLAAHIAAKDDWAPDNAAGDKIAQLFDLRSMSNIDPTLGENLAHFILLDGRRDQRFTA